MGIPEFCRVTSPELLSRMQAAVNAPVSAQQRFEQKVSFVFGSLGKANTLTRDEVRELVAKETNFDLR